MFVVKFIFYLLFIIPKKNNLNICIYCFQTQTIYHGCKRKPSVYGSRHLTYDIPFPIDECNSDDIEIHRRPSKRERRSHNNSTFGRTLSKSIFRTNSLNVRPPKIERMPVVRNISSPITMQYGNHHR